jgi:hypothetical protein
MHFIVESGSRLMLHCISRSRAVYPRAVAVARQAPAPDDNEPRRPGGARRPAVGHTGNPRWLRGAARSRPGGGRYVRISDSRSWRTQSERARAWFAAALAARQHAPERSRDPGTPDVDRDGPRQTPEHGSPGPWLDDPAAPDHGCNRTRARDARFPEPEQRRLYVPASSAFTFLLSSNRPGDRCLTQPRVPGNPVALGWRSATM